MVRHWLKRHSIDRTDWLLWLLIACWTGVIYATLSVVPVVRKWLVERFGHDVYDCLFPLFILLGLLFIFLGVRKRVRESATLMSHAVYFLWVAAIGSLYASYLLGLEYAVERVHLLEYGGLSILFYIAFNRKIRNLLAVPLSLLCTYLAGIGDETIQSLIPNRVAEIRDCVTNAVSGLLGLMLFLVTQGRPGIVRPVRPGAVRGLVAVAAFCAAATGYFIHAVHGFGCRIDGNGSGTIFSSLSTKDLERINAGGAFASPQEQRAFHDEARRHLFQRDFYFTNDFRAGDGSSYKQVWRAWWENRILETQYPRFMSEHAAEPAARFSGATDRKVGKDLGNMPVVWPDSVKRSVESQAGPQSGSYVSRVKSTIITAFTLNDLLFWEALVFLVLVWCWTATSRREPEGRFSIR
jgi:VanZ family protein